MKLDQATIAKLAEHLENCELEARDTTKITDDYPDMDWEDAYAIQYAIRARKLARGARVVGLKAGLTSRVVKLGAVVYHHKLGSLGDRTQRLSIVARKIAGLLGAAIESIHMETSVSTLFS